MPERNNRDLFPISLNYQDNDEINLCAGADIFYGIEDGSFSQFKQTGQPKTALFNVAITRYGVQTPILFS